MGGLISAEFAAHDEQKLADFQSKWAVIWPPSTWLETLLNPYAAQPSRCIRDYFGETTAFYFEWCGFTIRALFLLAILGVLVAFAHIGSSDAKYRTEGYRIYKCFGLYLGRARRSVGHS